MNTQSLNQILVAVDGSDHAGRAAQFGARLAGLIGAELTLLFVFPASLGQMSKMVGYPAIGPSIAIAEQDFDRMLKEASSHAFSRAREAIADPSIQCNDHILRGDPAEAIIDFCGEQSDTLLVIGSRGLSTIKGLVLGSVSERVVRHAGCPVTIVH